jgi:hypothetical protein
MGQLRARTDCTKFPTSGFSGADSDGVRATLRRHSAQLLPRHWPHLGNPLVIEAVLIHQELFDALYAMKARTEGNQNRRVERNVSTGLRREKTRDASNKDTSRSNESKVYDQRKQR